jgi:hypothetical protein
MINPPRFKGSLLGLWVNSPECNECVENCGQHAQIFVVVVGLFANHARCIFKGLNIANRKTIIPGCVTHAAGM